MADTDPAISLSLAQVHSLLQVLHDFYTHRGQMKPDPDRPDVISRVTYRGVEGMVELDLFDEESAAGIFGTPLHRATITWDGQITTALEGLR
jgi:hypothetical protein